MDSYTNNNSQFPYVTWIYQKYFPISRIGWGLHPDRNWGQGQSDGGPYSAASAETVASRMDEFEAYGSSWISLWAVDPGSAEDPNMTTLSAKWAPWAPRLRKFLQGGTTPTANAKLPVKTDEYFWRYANLDALSLLGVNSELSSLGSNATLQQLYAAYTHLSDG